MHFIVEPHLGVGGWNKAHKLDVFCVSTSFTSLVRAAPRRLHMNVLFTVAAIASLVKSCICLGSDTAWTTPRSDAPEMRMPCTADQLSSNPLWHSAAIASIAYTSIDRPVAK